MKKTLPAILTANGTIHCEVVILDLDGTVVDSGPGIKSSIHKTISRMQLPSRTDQELEAFIGPPVRQAFKDTFSLSDEEAERALKTYRAYYFQGGMYEAFLYDGIPELLKDLKDKGYRVSLGTSKAWVLAHRILRHFGLRSYFEGVFGCYLNGRLDSKELVLQAILDHYSGRKTLHKGRLGLPGDGAGEDCAIQPLSQEADLHCLMIGDRFYDVEGAKALGIPTIGVTFGYGTREELQESGAALIVDHPLEISARLPALR
ncbi:MAG: HAD hydrolase-like protein [Clostridiales bacterium]|nr:HAD hydrolase-like protein [Clostridiales bacterium]